MPSSPQSGIQRQLTFRVGRRAATRSPASNSTGKPRANAFFTRVISALPAHLPIASSPSARTSATGLVVIGVAMGSSSPALPPASGSVALSLTKIKAARMCRQMPLEGQLQRDCAGGRASSAMASATCTRSRSAVSPGSRSFGWIVSRSLRARRTSPLLASPARASSSNAASTPRRRVRREPGSSIRQVSAESAPPPRRRRRRTGRPSGDHRWGWRLRRARPGPALAHRPHAAA